METIPEQKRTNSLSPSIFSVKSDWIGDGILRSCLLQGVATTPANYGSCRKILHNGIVVGVRQKPSLCPRKRGLTGRGSYQKNRLQWNHFRGSRRNVESVVGNSQRGGGAKRIVRFLGGKTYHKAPPPKPVLEASESGTCLVCVRFL